VALLETEDIVVRFGGHKALSDVSLGVDEGTITGLIGPNGAGKTTLFNVITGLQPPSAGRIKLDGKNISRLKPHKRARRGMARTFQKLELFTSLTVRDNIRVAGEIRNRWANDNHNPDTETDRILELLSLEDYADREMQEIPTGQARVVEVGRALMTRPRVLLLDEPASGQTDQETEEFGALLKRLVDHGTTIFLVEHDMALVMAVCDHLHVLDLGQIIASGAPTDIQKNELVLDAYLGAGE
jgi:branched-chain amino acid transport system ATP-binding protein